jgi:tRNA(adenine34) deaminase
MREALALAGQSAHQRSAGGRRRRSMVWLPTRLQRPIARADPTAHAEIMAIRQAAAQAANYRLTGATLYCTLEPCVMCAGALVAARIERLVFGARDLRFGGVRSKFQVADSTVLNHRVEVVEGVLAVECVELLRAFFEAQRRK